MPMKLIIVDDEKITRDGLSESIPWSEFGIDAIYRCEDGKQALDLILEVKPQIVLSDIRMPVMDGIELAERVQKMLPGCKFIFLSGYSDKEYLKSAIQLNAVDYVEKPINTDELTRAIRKAVRLCREQSEDMKQKSELTGKLQKSIPLLKEKLALELLSKQPANNSLLGLYDFEELGMDARGTYITIVIKIYFPESAGPEQNQLLKMHIRYALEQYLAKNGTIYVLSFKDENFLVIHAGGGDTKSAGCINRMLQDILELTLDLLQNRGKVFITSGKQVRGVENIHESYHTAIIAMQKEFFTGCNHFAAYREEDAAPYSPYILKDHVVQQLENLVRNDREVEAAILLKRLSNELRSQKGLFAVHARGIYMRLAISLAAVAEERNISLCGDSDLKSHLLDSIANAHILDEIEACFTNCIHLIALQFKEKQDKSNSVFTATNYIKENYKKEDLSLQEIAKHIALTPTHLCHVFKKETGKTLNQFILEIRMEEAKKLLKDKRAKLYEVANSVGYSDSNYFAKAFKKYTGLTPTDFKEKYLL